MAKGSSVEASKTRERILDAATEVIAERGYSAAGVQEIVELSGMSKGSFYFHFPSKEEMAMALIESMSGKLLGKVQDSVRYQPTPLHRVAGSIDTLMVTFERQRKLAQVLLLNIIGHGKATDRKFLPIRERFLRLIQQELDAAVECGQIERQDTTLAAQIWVGAFHEVILGWLLTGKPKPLTSCTESLKAALLRSVGADSTFLQNDIKGFTRGG